MVETYVVKPEKQTEFMAFVEKFVAFKEKNAKKFEEAKSWRLLRARMQNREQRLQQIKR